MLGGGIGSLPPNFFCMYTTIIHPLRKALQLSCNEYIVLDLISRLSHNVRYNGWCIASKANIAKMTDLSERKIYDTINKLIALELIEKDEYTKNIRTTDRFNKLMAKHDNFYLGYKDKEESFFSGKPLYAESADTLQKVHSNTAETADQVLQKVQTDTAESAYNNNINNKILHKDNNNISKDIQVAPESTTIEIKESFGNEEINKMLNTIKDLLHLTDFKETKAMQRNFGKHLVGLKNKIGKDEFGSRFMQLAHDEFHMKNMGSLKYIYNQIKGFVPIVKDKSIPEIGIDPTKT